MRIPVLLAVAGCVACLPTVADAQWYGSFDAMAVTRTLPDGAVFQRNQSATQVGATTLLSANDLDLDFVSGGRVTLGNRSGLFGVEGSYLVTDEWNKSAYAFNSSPVMASPFTPVGALINPAVDNNTTAMVSYATQMQGAELSLTQRIYSGWNGDATLMYGAKSVWIDESLAYFSTNGNESVSISNQLFGPQLGVLVETPLPGTGMLDATFKIAVTNHTADKTAVLNGLTTLSGSENGAAFVSDIGINSSFFITQNVLLRFGYHVLSVTDVDLATENLENLAFPPPVATFGNDRVVVYQSLYLGVTLRR